MSFTAVRPARTCRPGLPLCRTGVSRLVSVAVAFCGSTESQLSSQRAYCATRPESIVTRSGTFWPALASSAAFIV